ncbi:TIGR03086 family metal-binding protein [Streptomyces sp. NPDC005151]
MTESTGTANASAGPFGNDPRPALTKAIALAGRTLAAVRADQYDGATPCSEYDVRTLAGHLVSVLRRVAVVGAGGDFFGVPNVAEDVADGEWAAAWEEAAREVDAVWSDDEVLAREFKLPWGVQPGSAVGVSYIKEFTLHTWDLATATGQHPEWDEALLTALVGIMRHVVPAQPRGNPVPFGPVVEVAEDAPDIDKLVGWYGRKL